MDVSIKHTWNFYDINDENVCFSVNSIVINGIDVISDVNGDDALRGLPVCQFAPGIKEHHNKTVAGFRIIKGVA